MKKHFKKFIMMGIIVVLSNLFWDSISEQVKKNTYVIKAMEYIGELFESTEAPFHAIDSVTVNEKQITLFLKEEAFVYLFEITEKESHLLFPNRKQSFNQYNPNISYTLHLHSLEAKHYLVASREPLKIDDEKVFLKELQKLKKFGKIDVREIL